MDQELFLRFLIDNEEATGHWAVTDSRIQCRFFSFPAEYLLPGRHFVALSPNIRWYQQCSFPASERERLPLREPDRRRGPPFETIAWTCSR